MSMRIFLATLLVLFSSPPALRAQDSIKLVDGERLFGEIRSESPEAVEFIDKAGRLLRIERGRIAELKPGRPIAKSLERKLEAIDQNDAAAILRIAEEALEERRLKNDGLRLLRRVLVLDPDRARARELLGHVRALDRWFENREEAEAAIAEVMEAEGLVKVGLAWASPEDADSVREAPNDWMPVENRWRLVSVVMKERGFIEWSGAWYPPEERDVIRIAKEVEKQIDKALAGSIKGETTSLDVRGRDQALRMSEMIEQTRFWFAGRFDLPFIEIRPDILNVVLANKEQYEAFLFDCVPIHRIREETIEIYRKERVPITSFNTASQVHDLESLDAEWIDHSVVHDVGQRLMDFSWVGRDMWFAPPWLRRAVGHHAEIAVLRSANLGIGAVADKYGRGGSSVDSGMRTLEVTRKRLAKAMKKRKFTARWLFGLERTDLTEESDDFAIVFLAWLFETRGPGFNDFIREPDKNLEMHARFERHLGMTFEQADEAFRAWLGA